MHDETDPDDITPKSVPYSRFQEVAADRKALRSRVAELEAAANASAAKLASVETLTTQVSTLTADLSAKTNAWDEERGLLRAGLTDPDDVDMAKLFHGKTAAEGRKPLADWWADLKADPTKAPRALQALLAPVAVAKTETTSGTATTTANAQGANSAAATGTATNVVGVASTTTGAKTGGQASSSEPLSAEKLREIRVRCEASGDWTEWKNLRGKA